jgi:hypothetical protein
VQNTYQEEEEEELVTDSLTLSLSFSLARVVENKKKGNQRRQPLVFCPFRVRGRIRPTVFELLIR